MEKRILVAYASKYGSTEEVANAIGESVAGQGAQVDVKVISEIGGLGGYDAVILGSAVRFGVWLKEAVDFVKTHQDELSGLPVGIFSVYILNRGNSEEDRKARQAYTAPVHALITPRLEGFFPGVMDMNRLTFPEKMLARAVKTDIGDYRDWKEITDWGIAAYRTL
jgi:menaquinone-dependent protoporphyrinogen oxidase